MGNGTDNALAAANKLPDQPLSNRTLYSVNVDMSNLYQDMRVDPANAFYEFTIQVLSPDQSTVWGITTVIKHIETVSFGVIVSCGVDPKDSPLETVADISYQPLGF